MVKHILLLLTACLAASAQAQIYKRVDPITGHTTYTSSPPPGTEVPELSTPILAMPTIVRPSRARSRAASPAPVRHTPSTYPRISTAEQQRRDDERRGILMDELKAEAGALAAALSKAADPDTVHRHKTNVASLKREIANIR